MNKNQRNRYKNKVGYCDNSDLPKVNSQSGGHYVYIRKIDTNGNCIVSTCTSLEDDSGIIGDKMKQLKKGNIYAIPKRDGNFSKWTGVNKNKQKVHFSKIKNIGKRHFKKKHCFILGKN